jgi:hypothetical protein
LSNLSLARELGHGQKIGRLRQPQPCRPGRAHRRASGGRLKRSMPDDVVEIGQVYRSVQWPRRLWRVTDYYFDRCRLEWVENPNVLRYPTRETLSDDRRYVRVRPPERG